MKAPSVEKIVFEDVTVTCYLSILGPGPHTLDSALADRKRFPRLQVVDFQPSLSDKAITGGLGLDTEELFPILTQRDQLYIQGRKLAEWRVADKAKGIESAMAFIHSSRHQLHLARLEYS